MQRSTGHQGIVIQNIARRWGACYGGVFARHLRLRRMKALDQMVYVSRFEHGTTRLVLSPHANDRRRCHCRGEFNPAEPIWRQRKVRHLKIETGTMAHRPEGRRWRPRSSASVQIITPGASVEGMTSQSDVEAIQEFGNERTIERTMMRREASTSPPEMYARRIACREWVGATCRGSVGTRTDIRTPHDGAVTSAGNTADSRSQNGTFPSDHRGKSNK